MALAVVTKEQVLQGDGPWEISDILKMISITQELITVLGEKELRFAFDEYVEQRPSPSPIAAADYQAGVYAMLGEREPQPTDLYRWVRDPPTDEPWAEALFVYRVLRHLESRYCPAVDWKSVDYWVLPTKEDQRRYRVESLDRHGRALVILQRMQEDRFQRTLKGVEKKIEDEVKLITGGTPGKQ